MLHSKSSPKCLHDLLFLGSRCLTQLANQDELEGTAFLILLFPYRIRAQLESVDQHPLSLFPSINYSLDILKHSLI